MDIHTVIELRLDVYTIKLSDKLNKTVVVNMSCSFIRLAIYLKSVHFAGQI